MAVVTLNYNSKNIQAVMTLEYILSMGFFKAETVIPHTKKVLVKNDKVATHFASEAVLGKDWLTIKEDEAWKTL